MFLGDYRYYSLQEFTESNAEIIDYTLMGSNETLEEFLEEQCLTACKLEDILHEILGYYLEEQLADSLGDLIDYQCDKQQRKELYA